jgi:hypothetical protein
MEALLIGFAHTIMKIWRASEAPAGVTSLFKPKCRYGTTKAELTFYSELCEETSGKHCPSCSTSLPSANQLILHLKSVECVYCYSRFKCKVSYDSHDDFCRVSRLTREHIHRTARKVRS